MVMKKHEGQLVRELREKAGWFIDDLIEQVSRRYPDITFDSATISRFERGKQEISSERMVALLSAFNLTRGEFFTLLESDGPTGVVAEDAGQVVRIPRIRSAVLDQDGGVEVDLEPRSRWCPFIAAELERRELPVPELVTMVVADTSMGAAIRHGEIVLVSRAHTQPVENETFAIISPGGCRLRRLQSDWQGGWMMTPESDKYPREPMDPSVSKVFGRVVWHGGFAQ